MKPSSDDTRWDAEMLQLAEYVQQNSCSIYFPDTAKDLQPPPHLFSRKIGFAPAAQNAYKRSVTDPEWERWRGLSDPR